MANKQAYPTFILDELKKGNVKYKDVFEVFLRKFKCSEPTFSKYWKIAQKEFDLFTKASQKEKDEQYNEKHNEAFKSGLKLKIDRLMILQNEVNEVLLRMARNSEVDILNIDGRLQKIPRPLTVNEMMLCKRTLRDLQSEISKIEGDYAPTKQDLTTKGEALQTVIQIGYGSKRKD
jgi:hypothetical protein